jgi:hypothetical protein
MNRKTLAYLLIIIALAVTWQAPQLGAAVSRLKTWASGETLTASDLNAEFNNVLNNGEDLGWPATKAKDMDAKQILLDGDQDTHVQANTDDRIDFAVGGFDGLRIDGTTASSVNGFDLQTQSTGVAPQIEARGEANIGIEIHDSNGNEMLSLTAVASAVNELLITNAATGNAPILRSIGEANIGFTLSDSNSNEVVTGASVASAVNQIRIGNSITAVAPFIESDGESNIGFQLRDSNSNEVLIGASTASAINEVTITNAAIGTAPLISATGGDTDVSIEVRSKGDGDINLAPQGVGQVQFNGIDLATVMRGHIAGMTLSNNGVDAAHDIDIAVGVATADDQSAMIVIATALTKQIDAAWAVGDDAGCLDGTESVGGTPDADTWYHVYSIRRSDTNVRDILCSENASAPTLPTNYDQQRRIGAVLTDGSANILGFSQVGDEFLWDAPMQDVDSANPGTAAVLSTLSVPTGIQVYANLVFTLFDLTPVASTNGIMTSPDQTDTDPNTIPEIFITADGEQAFLARLARTNTSGQVRFRISNSDAGVTVRIVTHGWTDPRGKE